MDSDKVSTASSVGTTQRRPLLRALVVERRILFACTALVGFSTFLWITAVCTEYWYTIWGKTGIFIPLTRVYYMYSTNGLWRICRYVWIPPPVRNITNVSIKLTNETMNRSLFIQTTASSIPAIPPIEAPLIMRCSNFLLGQEIRKKDPAYDPEVAAYCRTMLSFAIMGIFVMAMGCGFSAYTFKNPRYMFKRLAAGIHFISTSCNMVVIQIVMTNVEYERRNVPFIYPPTATHTFGISFALACIICMVNFFSFCSFLWFSRKKKGLKAATDEIAMADEPINIGR